MKESQSRRWQNQIEKLGKENRGNGRDGGGKSESESQREKRETSELDQMSQDSNKLRENAIRRIHQVLTRGQRSIFNKMLGDHFDLSRLGPIDSQVQGVLPPADEPAALEPVPKSTTPQPSSAPKNKRSKKTQSASPPQPDGGR